LPAILQQDIACQSATSCVTVGIGLGGVMPGIEYTKNGQVRVVCFLL
jgi:hypothetical protein